jgi:hypothetical protein
LGASAGATIIAGLLAMVLVWIFVGIIDTPIAQVALNGDTANEEEEETETEEAEEPTNRGWVLYSYRPIPRTDRRHSHQESSTQ